MTEQPRQVYATQQIDMEAMFGHASAVSKKAINHPIFVPCTQDQTPSTGTLTVL